MTLKTGERAAENSDLKTIIVNFPTIQLQNSINGLSKFKVFIKHKVKRSQITYCFQWDSEVRIEWTWEKSCEYDASLYFQCYLTTNSYIFYEVANSSKFLRTHSYDLSKPQWQVRLGAGLSVGHSYKFIRIVQLVKYIRFSKNHHLYEWDRTNSYELATS